MSLQRHFLGWDIPVVESVRRFLIPAPSAACLDMGDTLVIVPTRQAGRRLREAMARMGGTNGSAILALRVVPPSFLLSQAQPGEPPTASPTLVQAAWARVLQTIDDATIATVFPSIAKPGNRDFQWCLQTGALLQRVRRELAQAGLSIGETLARHGEILDERERWKGLAVLESAHEQLLDRYGVVDPETVQRRRAAAPRLPATIHRIVMAATPDAPPIVLRAVDALSRSLRVDILVCAPPELARRFDAFGSPDADYWTNCAIPLPDSGESLQMADSPRDQALRAIRLMNAAAPRFAASDTVIGVPDKSVTRHLVQVLRESGIEAGEAAEYPLTESRIFRLIRAFLLWLSDESYQSLRHLLRHPDILGRIDRADEALRELDTLQNRHLPTDTDAVESVVNRSPDAWPALRPVLAMLRRLGSPGCATRPTDAIPATDRVRAMLGNVYADRLLRAANTEDQRFRAAAEVTAEVLDSLRPDALAGISLTADESAALLVQQLAARTLPATEQRSEIDIEGWLELGWNDAPSMILTGMNEGFVPGGRLSDAFIPDTLRTKLGLRDDRSRLARDAYWLSTILATRGTTGSVALICGRTGTDGDPLKPSRLLFRCPDQTLHARCKLLFADRPAPRGPGAASVSFRLTPPPAARAASFDRLPVTAFRTYLECPFRFFLRYGLRMEPLADDKREPDALDFGILVHSAIESLANTADLRDCTDARRLQNHLSAVAREWMRDRYGPRLSLPLQVALDGACRRLSALARIQAEMASDGWELLYGERRVEIAVDGVTLVGKIDRIDRYRENGTIRIIDYKTGDRAVSPESAHLATLSGRSPDFAVAPPGSNNRPRQWTDLQLPLYLLMARKLPGCEQTAAAAYGNLPKSVPETRIDTWDTLSETLLDSAWACARAVVARIRKRQFWPPAERVRYDPFEAIFMGLPADSLTEAPHA